MINRTRIIDTFSAMVGIDSLSFKERQMADHVTAHLTELGFTVKEDNAGEQIGGNAGNIYGYLPGTLDAAPLLFSAHMDTVEPGVGRKAILQEDGRITSDGTTILGADDQAGIAAALEAVQTIQEKGLAHRPIEVLFTVAEEAHCMGSAVVDAAMIRSKEAYVMDLNGHIGTAAYRAPAIMSFTAIVKGKASHAGVAPQDGIHAIRAAALAVSRLELGHVGEEMTVNVGVMEGGSASNVIPDTCKVIGEVRGFDQTATLAQLDKIGACFHQAAAEVGATVDWAPDVTFAAYGAEEGSLAIERYRTACEQLGLPVSLITTYGGSDLNNLAAFGIGGLVISNGMVDCHSVGEYIVADDLEKLANLVVALMTSEV